VVVGEGKDRGWSDVPDPVHGIATASGPQNSSEAALNENAVDTVDFFNVSQSQELALNRVSAVEEGVLPAGSFLAQVEGFRCNGRDTHSARADHLN